MSYDVYIMFYFDHERAMQLFHERCTETQLKIKTLKYLRELERNPFKKIKLSIDIIELELQRLIEETDEIVNRINNLANV